MHLILFPISLKCAWRINCGKIFVLAWIRLATRWNRCVNSRKRHIYTVNSKYTCISSCATHSTWQQQLHHFRFSFARSILTRPWQNRYSFLTLRNVHAMIVVRTLTRAYREAEKSEHDQQESFAVTWYSSTLWHRSKFSKIQWQLNDQKYNDN